LKMPAKVVSATGNGDESKHGKASVEDESAIAS
jgi:hypothetical protein